MNKYLLPLPLITMLLFTSNTFAMPKPLTKGGMCININFKGNDSVFICDHIGMNNVSQIYEKGWKVVSSYIHEGKTQQSAILIIEQQG